MHRIEVPATTPLDAKVLGHVLDAHDHVHIAKTDAATAERLAAVLTARVANVLWATEEGCDALNTFDAADRFTVKAAARSARHSIRLSSANKSDESGPHRAR